MLPHLRVPKGLKVSKVSKGILFFLLVPLVLFQLLVPPPSYAQGEIELNKTPEEVNWVYDKDVDFAGKTAVRSEAVMDWAILNYHWSSIGGEDPVTHVAYENPFNTIWSSIRNIVFAVLGLFILAAAFLLIITQGRSITVRKFVIRFVVVVILVFLSFSIVQFLYQTGDVIQDFFLQVDKGGTRDFINHEDLLWIGFDYHLFVGNRIADPSYNEAAFMSTLLVKLTAISYYAIFIILIVRKVILWFFIVVSPIFPLLLLFNPLRNSAKIWVGEFFRWLLYAPLFAIFLSGLVSLWRLWDKTVPLNLSNLPCSDAVNPATSGAFIFPSATNIMLGGPCQQIGWFNNLNTADAFIEYVVALLMLWMVIIVPFILLRIFLSYFQNFQPSQTSIAKYLSQASAPILNKYRYPGPPLPPGSVNPPPGSPPPPPGSFGAGLARSIPNYESSSVSQIEQNMRQSAQNMASEVNSQTSANVTKIEQLAAQNIQNAQSSSQYGSMPAESAAAMRIEEQVARNLTNTTSSDQSTSMTSQALQSIEQQASNVAQMAQTSNQTNIVEIARSIQTAAANNLQTQISTGQVVNNQAFKNIANQAQTLNQLAESSGQPALAAAASRIEQSANQHIEVMEQMNQQVNKEILNLTSLSIPTMQEIAKYETTLLGGETPARIEVQKVTEVLSRISGASPITSPAEREYFEKIKERLTQEAKRGNTVATSILSASKSQTAAIPETSAHPVNLEQYEEVKKVWTENYKKLDPPNSTDGKTQTRRAWVQQDIKKISEAIDLLLSGDPEKQKQGKEIVSKILPFLLLGGFSKQEIIAYLKAKLEAAKAVLKEVLEVEEKEETLLPELEKKAKPKAMEAAAEIPEEKPEDKSAVNSLQSTDKKNE